MTLPTFINPAQIGGIETAILDNGPGRGSRIAWINTGSGLRFKVVLDRAMDIADAFFNQHSLAWLSHGGITPPDPASDRGAEWLRTFGGGLLTTCGLTHVGGPETDEFGERGVHGPISNTPAELESIVQPDPARGRYDFSLTGVMRQSRVFGPCLELRRTISGRLGEAVIRISDEVYNRGNTPAPHMLLYHFNFGWPLVDEGSEIVWEGEWQSREGEKASIFKDGNNFKRCSAPLDEHRGGGEEAAFISPETDGEGYCLCGIRNPRLGLSAQIRFRKDQLPWLTNWQHWGPGEYVTGLEPGTNPPIGQAAARAQNSLRFLQPGETIRYDLTVEVTHSVASAQNELANSYSTQLVQ